MSTPRKQTPPTPLRGAASPAQTPDRANSNNNVGGKSDDIAVVCRVRPIQDDEVAAEAVQVHIPNTIDVVTENGGSYSFSFDRVLDKSATQADVFEQIGGPVVDCVMAGFNATIFAYGQTSAGKTHTMVGTNEDPGIIFRFAKELFARIDASPSWLEYSVQTQYVEIYLEKVRDLLEERGKGPMAPPLMRQNLHIREDPTHGVHIPDATIKYVCSAQELLDVCEIARQHRATSETLMNQVSSRSHSVMLMVVTEKDTNTGVSKTSKINLVDLAGSEAVKRSGAEGDRLSEAQAINSSLSALGNVIHALTSDKATYIPYRDSKLTRILQESLGGNAKTWLIVNVSPSTINATETLSTLRFGQRAKSVKNRAVVNQTRSAQELEIALRRAEERILQQDALIAQLRAGVSDGGKDLSGPVENADLVKENLDQAEALRQLNARVEQLERERDEARQGWEKSREEAVQVENDLRNEIAELKSRLEAALVKAAEAELASSSQSNTTNAPSSPGRSSQASIQAAVTPTRKHPSELRLDQLVQVHRQLLRKYAALELTVAEAKRNLAVSEERIRVLTNDLAMANELNQRRSTHAKVAKVVRGGGTATLD